MVREPDEELTVQRDTTQPNMATSFGQVSTALNTVQQGKKPSRKHLVNISANSLLFTGIVCVLRCTLVCRV